ARTRLLLEGPIVPTLLRIAAPNLVVNVVLIAVTTSVDAHFVGQLGLDALAGLALVFPLIMLMQQMANMSMGGAIAAAVARAIGAGRRDDAVALVVHALVIAWYLASGRTALTLSLSHVRLNRRLFAEILRVGAPLSLHPILNNVALAAITAYAGMLGATALASFGAAVRLEYLLYPINFGLGAAVLAMVGTNMGARQYARAARIAWIATGLSACVMAGIGLLVIAWPNAWTALFSS